MEERECLVAAPSRCAVSQIFNLPPVAREQPAADYKSAIRQIKNLRHAKHIPGGTPGELAGEDACATSAGQFMVPMHARFPASTLLWPNRRETDLSSWPWRNSSKVTGKANRAAELLLLPWCLE
jgi:hypothetical protein